MAITIRDIAGELGISAATVSRSLRHDRMIHPDTRARVSEAAQRMGYSSPVRRVRPSPEGGGRHRSFVVFARQNSQEARSNGVLMDMMAGVIAVADQHEMQLKLQPWSPVGKQILNEKTAASMIDDESCVAVLAHGNHNEQDLAFLARRVPLVSLSRVYGNLPMDAVVADNIRGVEGLVQLMVGLGHRRVAWVSPNDDGSFVDERRAGFVQGCLANGLELDGPLQLGREFHSWNNAESSKAVFKALDAGATAFVCGGDAVALDIIQWMEGAGVRVPADVSVTGFDAWSRFANGRHVTSVDPHFADMGKAAARLALQRAANLQDRPCILAVRGDIVIGDTTGPRVQS